MGLRINTNISALNASRVLRRSTLDLNKTLEQLSSGLRINRAADDAAGLAIAEGFRSQVLGTGVAQRNVQDGISLVQTAEGALSETTNILQRMRELAVQAANGTQSGDNRLAIQSEINQLAEQITSIAKDTEFNGVAVLNTTSAIVIQAGIYSGQTLALSMASATAAALGVSNLSVVSMTLAASAISVIDTALKTVNTVRANLGAYQNRLEFTMNTLGIQQENASSAESAIRDADIAQVTIRFTRNQILVNAGTSILAQANVVPQTALQLLR